LGRVLGSIKEFESTIQQQSSSTATLAAALPTKPVALRKYTCEFCGKAFVKIGRLNEHVNGVHKKLRDFSCELCGKTFARKGDLKKHSDLTHKRLREHTCELCGKVLANVGHMRRHVNQLREHTCEYCGKAFADIDDVKRHVNGIHKRLRVCKCDICGVVLTDIKNLKKHVDAVHKQECQEVRSHLYTPFVYMTKAFDTMNRDGLWKFDCPERFMHMVRQLHDGMTARVTDNGTVSEAFAVTNKVNQGYALAPTLFRLMLSAMLMDSNRD
uniref:Zinc finger protein n=1 Tax=Schistocephalus solidus TaxID=70667 RepID=A0A183SS06_SCHSO